MMAKRYGVFLIWLACMIVLAGCSGQTLPAQTEGNASAGAALSQTEASGEAAWPVSFTDSTGRTVTLNGTPQRVAVLFSSYADIWQMAGGQIAVTVGDAVERGFAPQDTPLVDDGAGLKIDTELLLANEPDFVIASADLSAQVEVCERMDSLGIPCAAFTEESFDDYLSMLRLFTSLTGNTGAYQTYGSAVGQEIDRLLGQINEAVGEQEPVKVLFIRAGSGYSSTRAKTAKDHFVGKMLEELGTVNIADEAGALSEGLALESVLTNEPDVILIVPQGDETATRAYMDGVLAQSGWRDLKAVKEGRCHYLSKDLFHYKPNARWGEAYRTLAGLLYPEAAV